MNITLNTKSLSDCLSMLSPICKVRSFAPIMSCVLIRASSDTVSIEASNYDKSMRVLIKDALVKSPGVAVLSILKLQAIVSTPSELTEIKLNSNNIVLIKAGKYSTSIPTFDAKDFPEFLSSGDRTEQLPKEFFEGIKGCYRAANKDEPSRYNLMGVLCGEKIAATNGRRFHSCDYRVSGKPTIIPNDAIPFVNLFSEGAIASFGEKISLEDEEKVFTSKAVDGSFPNYKHIIPLPSECFKITVSRDFKDDLLTCRRSSVIVGSEGKTVDPIVTLEVKGNCLRASSKNIDGEETVCERECSSERDYSISFNAAFMIDVITSCKGDDITLYIRDRVSPIMVLEGPMTFIVLPARVN